MSLTEGKEGKDGKDGYDPSVYYTQLIVGCYTCAERAVRALGKDATDEKRLEVFTRVMSIPVDETHNHCFPCKKITCVNCWSCINPDCTEYSMEKKCKDECSDS
jgi:hypothetical protein